MTALLASGTLGESVPVASSVSPAAVVETLLVFHCPNCQLDYEWPFCDWCGRNLVPLKVIDRGEQPSRGWAAARRRRR